MAKQSKSKPKFTPKQVKAMASTPIPKPGRGDPLIGAKRKKEARSAAIGRGIMNQM